MRRSVPKNTLVDTSFLVALVDPRDGLHEEALALATDLDRAGAGLVTTDAVLVELANYFARSPLRGEAIAWIDAIRANPKWVIVALERPLLQRGETRYRRH